MNRIGIDFGGTKIEAAALDASGAILARLRLPNPGGYEAAIGTVKELAASVEDRQEEKEHREFEQAWTSF